MKVLVIADIHGRKFWRKVIEKNCDNVDKIIFLGDYLDPYPNELEENPELMECRSSDDYIKLLEMLEDIVSLKKKEPNKYILLTGNHTDTYIWSKFRSASRTDYVNWEKYHKFFSQNLKYFNLVWIENNVIFSHAGISEGWANEFLYRYMLYNEGAELERDSLVYEAAKVLMDTPLDKFNIHYIYALRCVSSYRWGDAPYGSCEWADIREHVDMENSKETIIPKGEDGIYQVFGHTQLKAPLITDKWACLDCRQGFIFDTKTYECKSCL